MTTTQVLPDPRSVAQQFVDSGLMDDLLDGMTDEQLVQLVYNWEFWRRPTQALPAGDWDVWGVIAGRGFGKTRTGAETCRELTTVTKRYGRLGIIGPTAGDARDVMIEGESGLLAVHPNDTRPKYEPSKRRLTWPNGARATVYSGEEPDRLRGPQHDWVWVDEPASMPLGEETVDNARLGLRLGKRPRLMITGTPRPRPWLRKLMDEPGTVVTNGSTYDNMANLADSFIQMILGRYEGTRLGRQELHAQWLDDVEGALWSALAIEAARLVGFDPADPYTSINAWLVRRGDPLIPAAKQRRWRTIVAVDPPAETAECGIVVGCAPINGVSGIDHAVLRADLSMAGRPEAWGQQVVAAWRQYGAEAVYVERNQGGDMTRATIHAVDPTCPVKKINAKESKQARAEPVAALYERGMVHHAGYFEKLEDQMQTWVPNESKSPDRLDAAVHCIRELLAQTNPGKARVGTAVHRRLT